MRFSRWVFRVVGIYGLAILVPQYFLESQHAVDYPPPINHPEYYYGFLGVAIAWQLAFLMISRDPVRYRLMILAAIVEKYSYAVAMLVLFFQQRIATAVLVTGLIDLCLGTLFIAAYRVLPEETGSSGRS